MQNNVRHQLAEGINHLTDSIILAKEKADAAYRKAKKGLLIAGIALLILAALGTAGFFTYRFAISGSISGITQSVQESELPLTLNFSLSSVPDYSGEPYAVMNENVPYFAGEELTTVSCEYYSPLDNLGRCGLTAACVGSDLMPAEERGDISSVTPSGWDNEEYDFIENGWLYNRCHLIGYQLTGENANERNLITGTRYMNTEGMLPFENQVASCVRDGEHVIYRVTPIYDGDNLVADGVLMEAMSAEDRGASLEFCVYCYNVQPGVVIDYRTGENRAAED